MAQCGRQCIINLRTFLMNVKWKTLKQAISLHLSYEERLWSRYFQSPYLSACETCELIFHPWQKLHDSMVLWRSWWTASSKMLINTLFYIAAFHFSPTNTALTLSVSTPHPPTPPPTLPPVSCRGYGYTDICNSIPLHMKDICENSSKLDSNTPSSCPCHFWSHRYKQRMKANKSMVNDVQWCDWPSN